MSKLLTSNTSLDLDETVEPELNDYLLGIDGGGTKTHAVIADAALRILGEGLSGPSNPLRAGLDEAIANVDEAVREACAQAGIDRRQVSAACLGVAGVNHPIHYHTMKDALDQSLGIRSLSLVTDVKIALAGALDEQPGVVIIAGTGSVAMGMNSAGQEQRSGGWGPVFSDEGSGFDIARRALAAVASSFDGRSPRTLLTERLCHRLGIASTADLPGVIYSSDSERVEIASLAEIVTETAERGDDVARKILADAGRELGRLAVSVIEKLHMQSQSFRVACVGSVFKAGDLVLQTFGEIVRSVAPAVVIGPPLFSPAMGALKLAKVHV
jgi:N-acetylglucosamine kinase-like BadF-type ATPase